LGLFTPRSKETQEKTAKTLTELDKLFALNGGSNAGINTLFGAGAAKKNGGDMELKHQEKVESVLPALIKAESNGNPKAKSPKGAMGLMQVMPGTFKEWAGKLGIKDADPMNEDHNRQVGTAYLDWLIDEFDGDMKLALAAYNYGIGNVKKKMKTWGKSFKSIYPRLPLETQQYVMRISKNAGIA
jgi:hypothetical protein